MHLTDYEQALLAGAEGPATRRAMEILVALGTVYDADSLLPIESAQIAGVSYKNLGDAGLEFLETWAAQGARARVPAMLNPAGMDLSSWRELGISDQFADKQQRLIAAYVTMAVRPTCTCVPYLTDPAPAQGTHLAWSESSAVSYANSVLGARTNREGGPSALAAAICGRTPRYGLHLAENRRPTHRVTVRCAIRSEADLGVLGYLVGRRVGDGIPLFDSDILRDLPPGMDLRPLCAAMAAAGAVALFHILGVTPEAVDAEVGSGCLQPVLVDSLAEGYSALSAPVERIDFVSIGCPHASPAQLSEIARLLEGKKVRTALWVTTARSIRDAAADGPVAGIEAAGGHVVCDTCLVVAPVESMGWRTMATNSAKAAFYAPSHSRMQVRLGTVDQCIESAITGKWSGGAAS